MIKPHSPERAIGKFLMLSGLLLAALSSGCNTTYRVGDGVEVQTGRKLTGERSGKEYYTVTVFDLHMFARPTTIRVPASDAPQKLYFRAWNDHNISHPLRNSAFQIEADGKVLKTVVLRTQNVAELFREYSSYGWGVAGGEIVEVVVPSQTKQIVLRHTTGDWYCWMEISDISLGTPPPADELVRDERSPVARTGTVTCDLRMISVADGSGVGSATVQGSVDGLAPLAKDLAAQLTRSPVRKGEPIAFITLRNRSKSALGSIMADEIADKVAGALIAARWFDVKERIDLRAILDEKDLDTAGIVKDEDVRQKLAGVKYIIIGGVTVTEPRNQ